MKLLRSTRCPDHCGGKTLVGWSQHESLVERPWPHADVCPCGGGDVNRDTSYLVDSEIGWCRWSWFCGGSVRADERMAPM
jgi:hypothetical protein